MTTSAATQLNAPDPASASNFYAGAQTKHLHLDWTVDYDNKLIYGSAEHTVLVSKDNVAEFVLDTSYLRIDKISVDGKDVEVKLHPRVPVLGSKLVVALPARVKKGQTVQVKIDYSTTNECTALGWLEKEQTSDGTHPFVYSQCQAIHARSLFPCQDTPAVKMTYSGSVRSSLDGCIPLLSARRTSPPATEAAGKAGTVYHYDQPVPMPSYLVAIAGGSLKYQSLGSRSGVWAEPSVLKSAAVCMTSFRHLVHAY